MSRGLTISCTAHAIALALALIAISAEPLQAPPVASLPISFISDKDFSQLTQGVKNAPKLRIDDPKPLADKVDQPKSVEQLAPKVADKPEIKSETAAAKPQQKQPSPKAEQKAADKPDPKTAEKPDPKPADKPEQKLADKPDKPKTPDYKPDQIAQLLKKDDAKKPPKPDDKPAQDAPKFDASQVAQLLDHREPRRQMAAAETLNDAPNVGTAAGAAAQLSQSEIDALRARISSCWSPPAGVDVNSKLYVVLRVFFRPDGSMAQAPTLVEATASALGPALAESAKRALLLCQPFTMLKAEHYDQWKDLELKFDPQELLGG